MRDNAGLFGLPQSLIDAVKEVQEGSAEYQNKVKAHMAKKGIKSLGDLSPEEKKKFFNDLDAAHKAKNEEKKMKDDEDEMEDDEEEDDDEMEMKKKGNKKEIEESDLPSSKEKQKTVMVVHKTSGKELKIQASALDKYKAMGYKLMEEVKDVEEAEDKKKAMASRIAAKLNSKASKMNADRAKTLDAMKRGQGEKGKNYLLSKNEEVEIEEAKVKGKGYDNPENERKAPEGKVPFTSFQQGKQGDLAARLHATSAKGKLVKGKAQSAPQKESYELTPEDIEFINSLNEKQ